MDGLIGQYLYANDLLDFHLFIHFVITNIVHRIQQDITVCKLDAKDHKKFIQRHNARLTAGNYRYSYANI